MTLCQFFVIGLIGFAFPRLTLFALLLVMAAVW